jgi:hypothetical protein
MTTFNLESFMMSLYFPHREPHRARHQFHPVSQPQHSALEGYKPPVFSFLCVLDPKGILSSYMYMYKK